MEEKEKIEKALLKVALGYQVAEVTEEYAEVDGELKLTKRKKIKKDIPRDLKAVQLLLTENGERYADMSDEELEEAKKRILEELKMAGLQKTDGQVRVEGATKAKKNGDTKAKKQGTKNKKEGEKK